MGCDADPAVPASDSGGLEGVDNGIDADSAELRWPDPPELPRMQDWDCPDGWLSVPAFVDESVRPDEWDFSGFDEVMYKQFGFRMNLRPGDLGDLNSEILRERALEACQAVYRLKEADFGEKNLRHIERIVLLQTIDSLWKDHLLAMDHLKEGIGLRGYGQRNPLQEYKKEGYEMFTDVMGKIKEDTLERTFKIQPVRRDEPIGLRRPAQQKLVMGRGGLDRSKDKPQTLRRQGMKVGRNAPCPCGSGKKYKKCCGS